MITKKSLISFLSQKLKRDHAMKHKFFTNSAWVLYLYGGKGLRLRELWINKKLINWSYKWIIILDLERFATFILWLSYPKTSPFPILRACHMRWRIQVWNHDQNLCFLFSEWIRQISLARIWFQATDVEDSSRAPRTHIHYTSPQERAEDLPASRNRREQAQHKQHPGITPNALPGSPYL